MSIIISKPGYDINTSDNNKLFDDRYPALKFNKVGSGKVVTDNVTGFASAVIPHTVGKIPMYFVTAQYVDPFTGLTSARFKQLSLMINFSTLLRGYARVIPTKSQLQLEFNFPYAAGTPQTLEYYYWILEDPVSIYQPLPSVDLKSQALKEYVSPYRANVMGKKDAGIYIAKDGKDVNSLNPDDFVFTGAQPTGSVKQRLSLQVTTLGSSPGWGYTKYKHGFGYRPQMIAFVTTAEKRDAGDPEFVYINAPDVWQGADAVAGNIGYLQQFTADVDEQNIYLGALNWTQVPPSSYTYRARTYTFDILLLMEEAI